MTIRQIGQVTKRCQRPPTGYCARRLTRTQFRRMSSDTTSVALDDELWTWRHLARYLHRARNAVFALVNEPGFPAPIVVAGDRLWVGEEVRTWILASREQAPAPKRSQRRTGGGRVLEPAATTAGDSSPRPRRGWPRHA